MVPSDDDPVWIISPAAAAEDEPAAGDDADDAGAAAELLVAVAGELLELQAMASSATSAISSTPAAWRRLVLSLIPRDIALRLLPPRSGRPPARDIGHTAPARLLPG